MELKDKYGRPLVFAKVAPIYTRSVRRMSKKKRRELKRESANKKGDE